MSKLSTEFALDTVARQLRSAVKVANSLQVDLRRGHVPEPYARVILKDLLHDLTRLQEIDL